MHVLLLTYAVPAIVVVVMETASPQAESAVIQSVVIQSCIIAVGKVNTVVGTNIRVVACGHAEVEVVAVVVTIPDTHSPRTTYHIYRTVEVVAIDESTVLTTTEHIHEVFVAHIEQVVIIVNSIVVSIYYIVYYLVHLIQEVKVDFIHVVVLTV